METPTQRSRRQDGDAGDAQGVRSIRRALDILSLLTDDTPVVSIRDITDATGLPKTTVLRLVHTLEQSGLLWASSGGYMAGPGLWRWAYLARRSWQLPPETQATMRDLGAKHRETVNFYVLRDIARVCIAQQESAAAAAARRPGRRRAPAVGRGVVQGPAQRRTGDAARPGGPPFPGRGEAPGDSQAVGGGRASRDGYAVSHGEREDGDFCRRGAGGPAARALWSPRSR